MPIITTPGQTLGQSDPGSTTATTPASPAPVSSASTSTTQTNTPSPLPPRLQSAFTPTSVHPISTDSIEDSDLDDDLNFDDDDFGDEETPAAAAPASSTVKTGISLSRMTEEQRRQVITSAFTLVFGKNPTDRDFSYYRFSTLTEESLLKSLLNLPEHKKMVEKAQEHTSLKQSVNELDIQVKQLNTMMQGMKQELVTMQELLVEKNRYIQQMRGVTDPQHIAPSVKAPEIAQQSTYNPVQAPASTPGSSEPVVHAVETKTLPTPMDEVKSMFRGLFGGK